MSLVSQVIAALLQEIRVDNQGAPVCPICGADMVPSRIISAGGSGTMYGWLCDCTAELRDAQTWREFKGATK